MIKNLYTKLGVLWVLNWLVTSALPQVSVLTAQYDNARTGANLNETVLNTSNVNVTQFGKLFSRTVDGYLYAQPLYAANITIPGHGTHNIVYAATMHNTVYAFDADDPNQATAYWQVNLGPSKPSPTPIRYSNLFLTPEIGILSTPVLDPSTSTLYVVAATVESGADFYRLHALDMTTGQEKFGGPVAIQASVSGTGYDNHGGVVTLNLQNILQRPGLLWANGLVYVAFGSWDDEDPYHGWVVAYSASNLQQQVAVYATTPNGGEGAVWQSGRGLVADSNGFLYLFTGNGDYDGITNFGDSFLKLNAVAALVDWFTPDDQATLASSDLDLGSSGPLLLPGTTRLIGGGKQGILYLVDSANMGHLQTGNGQIVQSFAGASGELHHTAYWNRSGSPLLYLWSTADVLKAFQLTNGVFNSTPVARYSLQANHPGGVLALSANGSTPGSGVLWATTANGDSEAGTVSGTLRAFDASNVANEVWDSTQDAARDSLGNFAKFASVTVANGKVYVPTFSGALSVYGLLGASPVNVGVGPGPVTLTANGQQQFTATVTGTNNTGVTWSTNPPVGTLDSSGLYTAPATISSAQTIIVSATSAADATRSASVPVTLIPTQPVTISVNPLSVSLMVNGQQQFGATVVGSANTTVTWSMTPSVGTLTATGMYIAPSRIPSTQTITITATSAADSTQYATATVTLIPVVTTGTALFRSLDPTTQGNWKGVYGGNGYNVINDTVAYPANLTVTPSGNSSYTWASSTTDVRALSKVASSTDRIAAVWYNPSSFVIDLSFSDLSQHQLALYFLDWDNKSRAETISITDANNIPLDTESVGIFQNGEYLVWQVSGHVKISVVRTAGANAVISGLFFDTPVDASILAAVAGTPQSALVNTSFSTAFQARLTGQSSNPISGATVTFSAPTSGAGGTFPTGSTATAMTDSTGTATSPVFTANTIAGAYAVGANATGSGTATFSLTNTPGPAATVTVSAGTPQTTVLNAAFAAALQAKVTDTYGNPVSGASVTFTAPGSGASALFSGSASATAITPGSGTAVSPVPIANGTAGTYQVTASASGLPAASFTLTNTASAASAAFVATDATTQGNWSGTYGSNGYNIVGDLASNPIFVTPATAGQSSYTWAATTTDVRALRKASNPASRIAATWVAASQFTIDLNINDTAQHQVALYCLDWDSTTRRETISVLDGGTGTLLSTQSLTASFNGGVYLIWNVTGHVKFQITRTAGANAVVSGLFFDPTATVAIATVAGTPQSTTVNTPFPLALQARVTDLTSNPISGVTVNFSAPTSGATGTFPAGSTATATTDATGTATSPAFTANTVAGAYHVTATVPGAGTAVTFSLTNTAGAAAALTASAGTPQAAFLNTSFSAPLQATVTDAYANPVSAVSVTFTAPASGASAQFGGSPSVTVATLGSGIAASPTPVANGTAGTYPVNASVAGLPGAVFTLTNSATPVGPSATFVGMDTTTQGTWAATYGSNGYNVIGDQASNPTFVIPAPGGQSTYTWAATTSDGRALQKASNPASRIAATWFAASQFTIDLNISDTAPHRVALYCLDWDSTARRETISVLDGTTGAVLSTQSLTSSFNGGIYLIWNVTGPVKIQITRTAGANAVVSGLFF